jgi:transposase-like protein
MPKGLTALDETRVKVNGFEHRVYAAIDVDGNEALSMRVRKNGWANIVASIDGSI